MVNGQLFLFFPTNTEYSAITFSVIHFSVIHFSVIHYSVIHYPLSIIHCPWGFSNTDALGELLRKWVIKTPDRIQVR